MAKSLNIEVPAPIPVNGETVGAGDGADLGEIDAEANAYAEEFATLADEFEDEGKIKDALEAEVSLVPEPVPVDEVAAVPEVPAEVEPEVKLPEPTPAEVPAAVPETPPTGDVIVPATPAETPETRTTEEVDQSMRDTRQKAHETLVETFKLTEEQEAAFERSPNEVLPQMAANLYLDLFDSMMQGVRQQMPMMIGAILNQNTAKEKSQQAFFNHWPDLAKPEYMQTIERLSNNYQAVNPNTDAETAIKEVGAQAWVALRLPLDRLAQLATAAEVAPEVPVPDPGGRLPANAGNVPVSAKAPAAPELNGFEQLANEFLEDDG